MRRTFAILCLLAGFAAAPLTAHAQGLDPAQEQFVNAFLNVRKGEEQENSGDMKAALKTFRAAADTLTRIKRESPNWQPDLVEYRLGQTMKAIDRVQTKMGGEKQDEPGLLPRIDTKDPLDPTNSGPLPPAVEPKPVKSGKNPKPAPTKVPDGADPLDVVKQRIADLETKLSDANDKLHEQQQQNQKLTKDIAEAETARKKAEAASKQAQSLAEVYQKNVLELKSKGESGVEKAKELEGELAAAKAQYETAKKKNADTDADLAAAEERIHQLLERSRAVSAKVAETSGLPEQIKQLQTKLNAEQKSKAALIEEFKKREAEQTEQFQKRAAEQAEQFKKREATQAEQFQKRETELKGEIASLTKDRDEARVEITRLKELNKQTDKLIADNATLLKKLGDAEKQILSFKTDAPKKDEEVVALRQQVTDVQKALTISQEKNATLQSEIGSLQKKVAEYTKEITQYKADKNASAEDRRKMEEENKLLQGIVMRVLQEDANRAQRKKMLQKEMDRLQIQSDVMLKQINYLTQPVVKLSGEERRLFKKPVIEVQDPNTLVAIKNDGNNLATEPAAAPVKAKPPVEKPPLIQTPDANPTEKPLPPLPEVEKPAVEKPSIEKPIEKPVEKPVQKPAVEKPVPAKPTPPAEQAKLDKPVLPTHDPEEKKTPETVEAPTVQTKSTGGVRGLPEDVKPLAEQAKQAFERDKYADAEKLYDKALQLAPNNLYLLSNRGVVQFRAGKYKQSEESFRKAIAIAPEDHFSWCTLGIVEYSQGKYDEAVNALTKSLAINPKNSTAHNYLGITAAQKGWIEAAQKELETAIQLDPKYADAWFNLAVTQTLKNPPNKEEARKAYKKAVELGAEPDPAMEQTLK